MNDKMVNKAVATIIIFLERIYKKNYIILKLQLFDLIPANFTQPNKQETNYNIPYIFRSESGSKYAGA